MDLNQTPLGNRLNIALFGRRNAGKSSLINALTGQDLAIVSDIKGTTTDPVNKAMELLPLGPVNIIDTPGLDDEGTLGQYRIAKTHQVLHKTDIALMVVDASLEQPISEPEQQILELITKRNIPYFIVYNKQDQATNLPELPANSLYVSAKTKTGIQQLKEKLGTLANKFPEKSILKDLVAPNSTVILVVPVDSAAPKGRLILPQQQVIRELLDIQAQVMVVQTTTLAAALNNLRTPPDLVITDSQAFGEVDRILPREIPLTSFSILFARFKGNLVTQLSAARAISTLQDGDKVLIAEGCTHHRQCDDIGTVKLPKWLQNYTQAKLDLNFCSGTEFPTDLDKYKLVIHCGACMLNPQEMKHRLMLAKNQNIPMSNYGIAIAQLHGILPRALEIFPEF